MLFLGTWVGYAVLPSSRAPRVIKIWNLTSGEVQLSLTGHVSTACGLVVSPCHPYIFLCGEDKVCFFQSSLQATQPLARSWLRW